MMTDDSREIIFPAANVGHHPADVGRLLPMLVA